MVVLENVLGISLALHTEQLVQPRRALALDARLSYHNFDAVT